MKITPQMADQAALIVQAFKEGREVLESAYGRELKEVNNHIAIGSRNYTYQLAPKEPAVCWRNEYINGAGAHFGERSFDTQAEATQFGNAHTNYLRTVKFVEASE